MPRIILMFVALAMFFFTVWAKISNQSIDYSDPGWAAVMVLFLALGVGTLVWSWMAGFENRAEVYITLALFMIHLSFDGFILFQVFLRGNDLPIGLVQIVVQSYWVAGLVDVLLMYGAMNFERTRPDYVGPEDMLREKELEIATLQHQISTLEGTVKNLQSTYEGTIKNLEGKLEDANKVHEVACSICGKVFTGDTLAHAERRCNGHEAHCRTKENILHTNGNGNGNWKRDTTPSA